MFAYSSENARSPRPSRIFHVLLPEHRLETVSPSRQELRSALVPVDDAEHPGDHQADPLGPFDRPESGRPGGDHVLHDGDPHARAQIFHPFDPLGGSVLLGLLPDDEGGNRVSPEGAGQGDGGHDRVRPQRDPPHRLGHPVLFQHLAEDPPGQNGSLGVKRRLLAVDVEIGLAPRVDDHLLLLVALLFQNRKETLPVARHASFALRTEFDPSMRQILTDPRNSGSCSSVSRTSRGTMSSPVKQASQYPFPPLGTQARRPSVLRYPRLSEVRYRLISSRVWVAPMRSRRRGVSIP